MRLRIVASDIPEFQNALERSLAGDGDAFCEICRMFETRLLRQALTLCNNSALAEDLSQDTLVEAWKCLNRYNGKCQFFTWLCAILHNRFRNTLRQKRPVPVSALSTFDRDEYHDRITQLTDSESTPDQATEIREYCAQVLECVRELPPHHQEVIYLRFYVDDSLEGIAEAIGCSIGTVKSRLFRALDGLRAMNLPRRDGAEFETKAGKL